MMKIITIINPSFIGRANKYNSLLKLKTMTAIDLIKKEREEQMSKHGYTQRHDMEINSNHQLSSAASILCLHESKYGCNEIEDFVEDHCPDGWDKQIWERMLRKPYTERIIIAAAMLAAERDSLDLLEAHEIAKKAMES